MVLAVALVLSQLIGAGRDDLDRRGLTAVESHGEPARPVHRRPGAAALVGDVQVGTLRAGPPRLRDGAARKDLLARSHDEAARRIGGPDGGEGRGEVLSRRRTQLLL